MNTTSPSVLNRTSSMTRHIRGQGLTEYAIIVSLVAIAAVSAASYFGDTVKASFVSLGSELSGTTEYDMVQQTSQGLQRAEGTVSTETTLGNYRD